MRYSRTREYMTQFSSNKINLKNLSQLRHETNHGKWVCCRSNTRSFIGWRKFHERKNYCNNFKEWRFTRSLKRRHRFLCRHNQEDVTLCLRIPSISDSETILFLINSVCLLLYSWVCKDNFEVIYQTQKTLNYHISKHCYAEWTQIFNELPGVWKYGKTLKRSAWSFCTIEANFNEITEKQKGKNLW